MNIAIWGKALRVIPRVSKKEWQKIDPVGQWLIATRSAVFVMTAFSVLVGAILTIGDSKFNLVRFLLCFVGLVLAHATNNLLNDYTDSVRGVDKDNYFRTIYGPQTLENGLWSKSKLRNVIIGTGLAAAMCGIILVALSGIDVLWLMLIGAFFVLFYTWPLKYIGLGEPAVLAVWGPLMVGGTYLAITGSWSWHAAVIGAVYAIGPTTVLFGKHTDKLTEDRRKGIHTLPVILGEKLSRYTAIGLMLLQPIFVVVLVLTHVVGPAMLVALLGLPAIFQAIKVFMKPRPKKKPANLPDEFWPIYLVGFAFRTNRITGSLFILGLLLNLIIK